jgi:hypothetical protein
LRERPRLFRNGEQRCPDTAPDVRERTVLTLQRAKVFSRLAAAAFLSVATLTVICSAADADGMAFGGCVGGGGSLNCVVRWGEAGDPYIRVVPQPVTADEKNQSAERDHKWEQRCQPVIAQDRYGVARYQYSAPGCEFGVIQ